MSYPILKFRDIDPLQDYYRDPEGNLYSVAKLVDDTKHLKPFNVPIAALCLSSPIWDDCNMFAMAFHIKRVMEADLTKPIILDWNGNIADGRHRILKCIAEGKPTIKAVRMTWKAEPDRRESDGQDVK